MAPEDWASVLQHREQQLQGNHLGTQLVGPAKATKDSDGVPVGGMLDMRMLLVLQGLTVYSRPGTCDPASACQILGTDRNSMLLEKPLIFFYQLLCDQG